MKDFVVAVDLAQGQWELVSWCEQEIVFDWVKLHVDWLEQLGLYSYHLSFRISCGASVAHESEWERERERWRRNEITWKKLWSYMYIGLGRLVCICTILYFAYHAGNLVSTSVANSLPNSIGWWPYPIVLAMSTRCNSWNRCIFHWRGWNVQHSSWTNTTLGSPTGMHHCATTTTWDIGWYHSSSASTISASTVNSCDWWRLY